MFQNTIENRKGMKIFRKADTARKEIIKLKATGEKMFNDRVGLP